MSGRAARRPAGCSTLRIEPFEIAVAEAVLGDLTSRIRRTRWSDQVEDAGWEQGTELGYLRGLLEHWAADFDWRAAERELNALDHHRAEVDGLGIHFVRARGAGPDPIPLVLTHGWPSTFLEYLLLIPLLTDPAAHGIDGPAFDLVIPSLPGYGFSDRPRRTGMTKRETARRWHALMRGLGYERYAAGGSDFGAGVTNFMALDEPGPLLGIHITFLEDAPATGQGTRPLSAAEAAYIDAARAWREAEYGYGRIQRTKPQTAGYGLTDSPAGLAAWIVEKYRSWGDTGGDVERRFTRELLLRTLTIYWATGTITSSLRYYWDDERFGHVMAPGDRIEVPAALALFPNEHVSEGRAPREWAERLYDVRRFTVMPRGGHFAALEEPELLARDIAGFFADLTSR